MGKRDYSRHFWSKVDKSGGCWLWLGAKDKNGYGKFGSGRAHRYAYRWVHGELPALVCHTCDTPSCVRPDHLYAGTPLSNMRDKVQRGRCPSGEQNGSAKLTKDQVVEIRSLIASAPRSKSGRSVARGTIQPIATRYGVSRSLISQIGKGQWWPP